MKIIIAGRTRSGKTTLAEHLAEALQLKVLRTCTNRPRRHPSEDTYHFYTKEEAAAVPAGDKPFLTTGLDGYERWTNKEDLLDADICILDGYGYPQAIRLFQTHGHNVALVYARASEEQRREAEMEDARAHGQDVDKAAASFDHRNQMESQAFDAMEARIGQALEKDAAEAILYPNATPAVESLFGEDLFIEWVNDFETASLDKPVKAIRNACGKGFQEIGGYRKLVEKEPLVLEPEDWTRTEWNTLCKLLGLPPEKTARIQLKAPYMEFFTNGPSEGPVTDFAPDVTPGGEEQGTGNET